MAQAVRAGSKVAKPVLSLDSAEAHRRVLGLYRGYYRYIPYIAKHFDIQKSEAQCKSKLREFFYKNACLTDLRVIDVLVIKGYMNLKEITHNWQQKGHIMSYFNPTIDPKPSGFINKFLANED
ncbi:NADH dehydrogenase [ubiquinone] 1 alpha subcomplex subunit 6-like [Danaus plexippus]|uniref:NADH dehydrogenase [ubiquinone] 1 alpha subcomplex subunit 6-like n=1 Tax=Danaus plexippus TaxID=13037 RepID=UPI002AB05B94|nr:NADH dehydrogenase [ubiquinone] 1 alpha subcomplex subunit 6-like [Danaus plexippus]